MGRSCYEAAGGVRGDQDHLKTAQDLPPDFPRMLPETPREIPTAFKDFGKLEKFEIVEQKSRQRSSTVVTRIGRSKTESTFTTVGPQRVAAVVARSALQ